jgi:hypothetical protein
VTRSGGARRAVGRVPASFASAMAFSGLLLSGATELRSATYVVTGSDEAALLVPAGVHVEPYENVGYQLDLAESTARIRVAVEPFGSRQSFRIGALAPARGAAAQLARAVAADATTRFEAVSRILSWVASNVRYDLDRQAPQDAESVLARRSAYCTGIARLSVALLDALAVPAREVAGYVVDDLPGGGRSGFHRWIEIFYDDRGWVFTDPLASHHFVPASYLRLASSALESDLPGPALLLSRTEALREIDQRSPAPTTRVRVRPNGDERHLAVLRLRTDAGSPATARLEGGGLSVRREVVDGEAIFFGLPPAIYELTIWSRGRWAAERQVAIERTDWTELNVAIGQEPNAGTGGTR